MTRIRFNWIGQGNKLLAAFKTTRLGAIDINGSRLTVEVNSGVRATKIKQIILDKLPGAKYRATVIESVDSKMKEDEKNKNSPKTLAAEKKNKELKERPEVQAKIDEILNDHYAAWPDRELPALDGMTPRQAVQTETGKEKVEALLLHMKGLWDNGAPCPEGTLQALRKSLELDE